MASPTDIAGLLTWYEADQLTVGAGLTNGTAVATWKDQSGNGHDATQATGADQPLVATASLNGLPAVTFDGANDMLTATVASVNTPITVFQVLKSTNAGSAIPPLAFPTIRVGKGDQGDIVTNNAQEIVGGNFGTTNFAYLTYVVDATSPVIRIGGVNQTLTGSLASSSTGTSLFIGAQSATGAWWPGIIAELLVYSGALSGPNIATVESYLVAKYFTTPAAPVVTTLATSGVGQSATLNGQVTANNEYTTYQFQWGTTNSYGSTTTLGSFPAGSTAQAVSAAISGLSSGTTYHYRLVATNTTGTTNSADQTFTHATSSINFRVLGLVADNGTNFLNDEYRSCVISTSVGNTSTTEGLAPVTSGGPSTYWMSPPQPSRFAVQSLYFDMRPVSTTPAFGTINTIGNPSFEYDGVGLAPQWWTPFSSGGTVVDQTVHSNQVALASPSYAPWTFSGFQSLHMKYTFSATTQQQGVISPFQAVAATTGGQSTPVSISVAYDLITASQASLLFTLLFYDNTQTLLPSPFGTASATVSVTGTGTLSGTFLMPANTVYIKYMISALSTGAGSFEAYVDAAQVTLTAAVQPYFDGDQTNTQWIGQRGNSASAQLVSATVGANATVIDGILVDPLTPNMAFNVYYSQDDAHTSDSMTETDWEQKLWVRVPEVYVCIQRQSYAFPQPIQAKYMKLEFTNLQAQSYKPGKFQKPVSYKKFPTWVANYFLTQLEQPSFVASRVNVEYDALSFAYDYFLDDLDQSPSSPTAPPQDLISQLTSYFNSSTAGVDTATLAQIDLVMKPFQSSLGSNINIGTSLGSYVSGLLGGTTPPVAIAEGGTLTPVDYSTVSTLQRESVVLEQNMPVMFFFVTCRHTYKELTAPFAHSRAYFAGVKEVAFLRNDYTVATDSSLYIESGGDPANILFSDWVLDVDSNWYTYGA